MCTQRGCRGSQAHEVFIKGHDHDDQAREAIMGLIETFMEKPGYKKSQATQDGDSDSEDEYSKAEGWMECTLRKIVKEEKLHPQLLEFTHSWVTPAKDPQTPMVRPTPQVRMKVEARMSAQPSQFASSSTRKQLATVIEQEHETGVEIDVSSDIAIDKELKEEGEEVPVE